MSDECKYRAGDLLWLSHSMYALILSNVNGNVEYTLLDSSPPGIFSYSTLETTMHPRAELLLVGGPDEVPR